MTYVRFWTCEPQFAAKRNLNTIFVYVFYMLRISRPSNHYLNATVATTSYKSSAKLNPRKVNNCHDFHVWGYGEYTHTDMTGIVKLRVNCAWNHMALAWRLNHSLDPAWCIHLSPCLAHGSSYALASLAKTSVSG